MRSASEFHLDRFSMLGVTLARFVPWICVKPWIFYLRSVRGGEGEGECFASWNKTTKHKKYIESRKYIAFCAPDFYRGQFPFQFSCFLFFVFSASWKSPKVIVFECWHLRGPSQIDSEHIWDFSWKHVFWGFRGHFDVILKSILRKYLDVYSSCLTWIFFCDQEQCI